MHADLVTETELALAGLWTEILQVDDVGRSDNFFDLGGDSMLATRLVLSARRNWNVQFSVRVLVESPVLKDLADRIDALVAGAGASR
ncbi:phosphopantetheine-binding protein [Actinoplanes sp. NPDC026623]|uniref:phosphopantetheine-binding protein n=1 Tax=Actinoplanes sp. NPDC026623 TaxID=3155610 RepID=UPI0033CA2078